MASIKKRPDGRWRARYRDGDGAEHARHFDRKIDGQKWLDTVTTSVVTGAYVDPMAGRITLATFFAQWAERQVWAPNTGHAMRRSVASATFRDVELRALRPSHIEAWVKLMRDGDPAAEHPRKLAASTIHTRVSCVRVVLRAAVRDKLIASDPSERITLPRKRRAAAAQQLPTTEQVGALLRAADEQFAPFLAVCAFAGLRLGEAAGLRVADVDFLRRTLTVSRQVQRASAGTVEIRLPKYGSERVVYLPAELVTLLSEHVRRLPGEGGTRWLFPGRDNNPADHHLIGRRWTETRNAAGISGFTLHDLRHFYASGLIAAGCDVVTVQRALGHANATTTLGTYAHLWPSAEDRTRQAAAGLLAAALTPADSARTGTDE